MTHSSIFKGHSWRGWWHTWDSVRGGCCLPPSWCTGPRWDGCTPSKSGSCRASWHVTRDCHAGHCSNTWRWSQHWVTRRGWLQHSDHFWWFQKLSIHLYSCQQQDGGCCCSVASHPQKEMRSIFLPFSCDWCGLLCQDDGKYFSFYVKIFFFASLTEPGPGGLARDVQRATAAFWNKVKIKAMR